MNKNKTIQYRTCVPNHNVNIVGFILNTGNNNILCNKTKQIIDIRRIFSPNENGYQNTLNLFDRIFTSNKKSFVYWMFNNALDRAIMDKYESLSKMTKNDYTKLLIANLYDDISYAIVQFLLKNIDKITISKCYKIFRKYAKLLNISEYSDVFNKYISAMIPNKLIQYKKEYDVGQDIFYGLVGKIIKLPVVPTPDKLPYELIQIKKKFDTKKETNVLLELDQTAICQHNLAWDQLVGARRTNISKFPDMLYDFISQYVVKNYEDDYICRSCSTLVNLKDYVTDGSFDSEGKFVSYSVPFDVPIEDIPEYTKFKVSIRNIEKIIEKLGTVSKINTLTGTTRSTKSRIRQIVKDVVDLVLVHNVALKNVYKERSEKISAYGLNKDLSNLFVFDLDNSIFTYSTKDKDLYKPIKRNNILMYIMFFVMLEIADSQTIYMTGDKVCNYNSFIKHGMPWFNNIYIRKNNQGTLSYITNYKLLCYMIFYMSCLISKYNMWQISESDDIKKGYNPNINKIIVHTFIDFLNSIVEVYSRKKKNYIYDLIANRFFNKLNTMFNNESLLLKIKDIESKTIVKKEKTNINKNIPILLSPYEFVKFNPTNLWRKCPNPRLFPGKFGLIYDQLVINNASNCKDGKFHKWMPNKGIIKCSICNLTFDEIDMSAQLSKLIQDNYKNIIITKKYNNYCKNHKCESEEKYKKQLIEMYLTRYKNLITHEKEKNIKIDQINIDTAISLFIKQVAGIVGTELNINNMNIYLQQDIYIINHDQNGNSIDKPIIFNKIIKKENHVFFKKEVLQYSKPNMEFFYDASTLLYIGYKDKNNEYHRITPKVYLQVNYSIENRLKLLGFIHKYINITNKKNELSEIFDDKQYILKEIIADIIRNRLDNLKKIINDIRRMINIVINKFDIQKKFSEDEINEDDFLKKYIGKIDIKNNNMLFKNYNSYDYVYEDISKSINVKYDDKYIEYDEVLKYDPSGNTINSLITDNLILLINDNYKSANIVYFILDLIINIFNKYNEDAQINSELKRFEYVLNTTGMNEISAENVGETEGFYGDYQDENDTESKETKKQHDEDNEENEALDVDTMMDEDDAELRNEFEEGSGLDYEIDYLPGVNAE